MQPGRILSHPTDMSRYANRTSVAPEKSRNEIEAILKRYGAGSFGYMTQDNKAAIIFDANRRRIRLVVELPEAAWYQHGGRRYLGKRRTPLQIQTLIQQETRQRWRALALVVKAKLEAVSAGVATFENEFMPYILLPNGKSVSEEIAPRIEQAYNDNSHKPLLLS